MALVYFTNANEERISNAPVNHSLICPEGGLFDYISLLYFLSAQDLLNLYYISAWIFFKPNRVL